MSIQHKSKHTTQIGVASTNAENTTGQNVLRTLRCKEFKQGLVRIDDFLVLGFAGPALGPALLLLPPELGVKDAGPPFMISRPHPTFVFFAASILSPLVLLGVETASPTPPLTLPSAIAVCVFLSWSSKTFVIHVSRLSLMSSVSNQSYTRK